MWCCVRDEGRPLAPGDQEPGANRCLLLPLRAVVENEAERTGQDPVWVRIGETSASEPLMTCRNCIVDVRTGGGGRPGMSLGGALKSGPCDIRLESGVTLIQALARNVRTCRLVGTPARVESVVPARRGADARHRDGATRSREEGAVIAPDRRGSGIQPWSTVNQQWEEPRG